MNKVDLAVIGAGPGGYEAAFLAADLGMSVALIEKDAVGGTCLNRGCIPTKCLLHSAEILRETREAGVYGIQAGNAVCDPARMQERKREVIQTLRSGIETMAKRKKVTLIRGIGTIHGDGVVSIRTAEGEEPLQAENILIATGSKPAMPPIPGIGLKNVVTSDELLDWKEPIGRLVIIGGGVIGMEFATLYEAMGTQVTVIEAMNQLLPNMDREIGQSLKMAMKKRGVNICTGARVTEIRKADDGSLICAYDTGKAETAEADVILVCVGRRPCTEGLFAEGIAPETERGRIVVNADYETSIPHVYAIGDVIGGIMLAHAATAEGKNAVYHMAERPERIDLRYVPSCVYTAPEIACVGMTMEEAKAAGIAADSRKALMTANGRTVIAGGDRGYIRTVFEKESGKLLGAQMMCERATDLISEFTLALSMGISIQKMGRIVRPHPTFEEAITDCTG